MDAEELRALQKPLKEKYRADPGSALVTLMAEGRIGKDITFDVGTGEARVEVGLHPASGGSGLNACSAGMLLEALVGCAGVTLAAVATAIGVQLRDAVVRAEGDLDFRGTLGVATETPVGLQRIRLSFDLDTDASPELQSKLIAMTERYCVVYQTLRHPPEMQVSAGKQG